VAAHLGLELVATGELLLGAQAVGACQQGCFEPAEVDRLDNILVNREVDRAQQVVGLLEGGDDDEGGAGEMLGNGSSGDDLYDQAVAVVTRDRKASTSYIQRRLQIGYNRAASLIERMEKEGLVGPANHAGKRDILAGPPPPV
jgi:DNA segregation ATPase FtsK/SpoIIIE-like protein